MKISVVIPTWNRATQLLQALESVSQQSLPPLEVIVVDDGSTDQTRKQVGQAFAEINYLYQQNSGVSSARNTGIRAAKGDWIALLDSDDYWQPDKLEQQAQWLHKHPDYRLCHCDEIWIRHGRRVNPMKKHAKQGGRIFRQCLPLCAISPSTVMIHRDLFAEVGLFDETLPACEDYDLWLRICALHPVLYLDKPLVTRTGGHADQLSRHYWGMDRFRIQALEKILASGTLDPQDHLAARDTLLSKLTIMINGAEKRSNHSVAITYRNKLQHYSQSPTAQSGCPA